MDQTYYKITNKEECHHGYQYVDGLNMLDKMFEREGSCVEGGLYFTTIEHIFKFLDYGCYLREITLPKDCLWVKDPAGDKFRADKIILGKRYNLSDPLTFQLLVKKGADIHAGNNCALKWASSNGHLDLVKYLVDNNANIHANSSYILTQTCRNGHLEVVQYLVEKGIDINAHDNYALAWASGNGHLKIVQYLVNKGANIHANDNCALEWASENFHLDVVKYLRSY